MQFNDVIQRNDEALGIYLRISLISCRLAMRILGRVAR